MSASPTTPLEPPTESQITSLTDLGFTERIARLALSQSRNDVESAANLALNGKVVDGSEVSISTPSMIDEVSGSSRRRSSVGVVPGYRRSPLVAATVHSPPPAITEGLALHVPFSLDDGRSAVVDDGVEKRHRQEQIAKSRGEDDEVSTSSDESRDETPLADYPHAHVGTQDDGAAGGWEELSIGTSPPTSLSGTVIQQRHVASQRVKPRTSSNDGVIEGVRKSWAGVFKKNAAAVFASSSPSLTTDADSNDGSPQASSRAGVSQTSMGSAPLSHQVIRSLPLGSLVPLPEKGTAPKQTKTYTSPPKMNERASQYDAEADSIVAGLFKVNSNTPPPPLEEKKEIPPPRMGLFGRRSYNNPNSSSVQTPATPSVDVIPPTPSIDNSNNASVWGSAITNTNSSSAAPEEERGRDATKSKNRLSARSMSPFFRRRHSRPPPGAAKEKPSGSGKSDRSASPDSVAALRGSRSEAADSDSEEDEDGQSEVNTESNRGEDFDNLASEGNDYDDEDEDDGFDENTELNTEKNAETPESFLSPTGEPSRSDLEQNLPQDLGEGPNVVLPEPQMFQTSTSGQLKVEVGRPEFGRDRCTLKMVQGQPDGKRGNRKERRYVVASDLSEESGYAVDWAISTVARDGDEVWLVNVTENEAKVDPKDLSTMDRVEKLRIQKERQTMTLQLSKQVNTILQRTNLNVTIVCQAVHAKNSRYMLLDLIDYLEPTLVIVGSRGLGKLKGTILGSMSHYLVQKSSVPVMVARRRLKRILKRTDPLLLQHSARVSLANASIEKATTGKEQDDVVDAVDLEAAADEKDAENEAIRAKEREEHHSAQGKHGFGGAEPIKADEQ